MDRDFTAARAPRPAGFAFARSGLRALAARFNHAAIARQADAPKGRTAVMRQVFRTHLLTDRDRGETGRVCFRVRRQERLVRELRVARFAFSFVTSARVGSAATMHACSRFNARGSTNLMIEFAPEAKRKPESPMNRQRDETGLYCIA